MLATIEHRPQEAALVRAAQSGDRVAFGALYEQYGRMVHGLLLARVSYSDAEDLLQEVFVKAMERLRDLREPEAFGGWLAAIARRAATDYQRFRKPEAAADSIASQRPRPDQEAFAILAMIQRLPDTYREPMILRLVEGMTGPEISQQTGLTSDSVRVNLCRGMKLLRAALKEYQQ